MNVKLFIMPVLTVLMLLLSNHSVTILQRMVATWLPVNLTEPWAATPRMKNPIVHHSKWFPELLITGIISLVVLLTATAIGSAALVKTTHTQHVIDAWVTNAIQM